MKILPHSLLLFILPFVYADVEFTSPAAGADIPVGSIDVQWKNSGRAPAIAELTTYILDLMVGGDDVADMLPITNFVSGGAFSDRPWNVNGKVQAGVAGAIKNGFFFRMISTSSNGGIIINYSDRFSISGLTGTTSSQYRNAALALKGDTSPPPRGGNVPAVTSTPFSSTAPTNGPNPTNTVTVTKSPKSKGTASMRPISSSHSSGPDAGVIAGVVVVCLAFLAGIVGLGVWAYIRRKRRRRRSSDQLDDKDELGKQPSVSVTSLSELSAEGRIIEAGDGLPPPEMDSTNTRAELAGDFSYKPSEMEGSPVETPEPLTPVASSINGEETLWFPTSPHSGV